MARVTHQGVAALYDVVEVGDELYLVMEYVDGKTLLSLPLPIPVEEFMSMASQAAAGLGAAHARDLVHGDIKPDNMMVTRDLQLKILDFSVAGVSGKVREDYPTTLAAPGRPGSVGFTPAYAAPELLRNAKPDLRADLFSLGVVFYQLLSAKHPFKGGSDAETAARILQHDPPSLTSLNPEVSAGLAAVIEGLLQKDPDDRYANAHDLERDLRRLVSGLPGTSRDATVGAPTLPTGSPTVASTTSPSWRRAAAGVGVLALLLSLVYGVGNFGAWGGPDATIEPARGSGGAFDAAEWVIAVLPVVGNSDDADISALNEGLALTLTTRLAWLSRERQLQVIPASALREQSVDTTQRARSDFGVSLVVNYSTRRIGEGRLRVAASLVDVATPASLDARQFEGTTDELIELEERVAVGVIEMLNLELTLGAPGGLLVGTDMPRAYELYLRGQVALADHEDPDNVDMAIGLFERALQVDGDYAAAHASLGTAFWHRYDHTKETAMISRARQECGRANELDEREAMAHLCLGTLHAGTGEPELAARAGARGRGVLSRARARAHARCRLRRPRARLRGDGQARPRRGNVSRRRRNPPALLGRTPMAGSVPA